MLQITPQHRLLLAVKPQDFRKGVDSLKAVCKQQLLIDPFSGTIFIFVNRSRTSVKILVYDGNGFWLCQKRFSKGQLKWWPTMEDNTYSISSAKLHVLLAQGDPRLSAVPDDWRQLSK